MGGYFQDQWKATPQLTVNLGLRYDRTFRPPYGRPEDNNMEVGDMNFANGTYVLQVMPKACEATGAPPCNPTPGGALPDHVVVDPRGKIYQDWTDNWQPRVGLAYRLTEKTALRAGFGIYFESWAALTQSSQNYSGTWPTVGQQIANNLNNPRPGAETPTTKATNPFPSGLFPEPTPFNQVQWFQDPNLKNAYSMQWNFGIQHQLITRPYHGQLCRFRQQAPGHRRLLQRRPYAWARRFSSALSVSVHRPDLLRPGLGAQQLQFSPVDDRQTLFQWPVLYGVVHLLEVH